MRGMISVVVPIHNEQDNIAPLLAEICACSAAARITEIIYVDDGSKDDSAQVLSDLKSQNPKLKIIRHAGKSGQSAALWTGIRAAKNDIIATLDGDGQNDPADIESVFRVFEAGGGPGAAVMVAGQRQKREDNWVRRVSSRLANGFRSFLLRDNTRDTGCSLKMFRRVDYMALPYFNHMHRFLPALMMRDGVKILHVDVSHRPRGRGVSKYGTIDRLLAGLVDILGVLWLMKRARPNGAMIQRD